MQNYKKIVKTCFLRVAKAEACPYGAAAPPKITKVNDLRMNMLIN